MKQLMLLLPVFLLLCQGCNFAERERAIEKQTRELTLKEEELLLKEKSLLARETELQEREAHLDSTLIDSGFVYHRELPGTWDVKMSCIETTCPGSAVGDTKTENWVISYQGKLIIARVIEQEKLTRVYAGYYSGNMLELTYQDYTAEPAKTTMMTVRLKEVSPGQMEGQREINRPEKCKVIYNVTMTKR
jgi:hypothetical protein